MGMRHRKADTVMTVFLEGLFIRGLRSAWLAVVTLLVMGASGWSASVSPTTLSKSISEDAGSTSVGTITSTITASAFTTAYQYAWYITASGTSVATITGGTVTLSGQTGQVSSSGFSSVSRTFFGSVDFTPQANWNGNTSFVIACPTNESGFTNTTFITVGITVTAVNDLPTFSLLQTQSTVAEDAGAQSSANWVGGFAPGGGGFESTQSLLGYVVTASRPELFSVQPAISTTGTLTYTPARNRNGSSTVTVVARDNGGTASGGNDTSASQTFTITITPVADGVIMVSSAGAGNRDGTTFGNAFRLAEALAYASTGEELWVQGGIHVPTTGTDRTATFTVPGGVTVLGGFSGVETAANQRDYRSNQTILSGDLGAGIKTYHVVTASSGAVLDGLIIQNGSANGGGTYQNEGGGIIAFGNLTLRNSVVRNNAASFTGGGLADKANGTATLTNVIFHNNTAEYGGAICSFSTTTAYSVKNAVFANNAAIYSGGAVYADSPSSWANIVVTGSSAQYSSFYLGGTQQITNAIFWGNTATTTHAEPSSLTTFLACDLEGGVPVGCTNAGGNISLNPSFVDSANVAGADGLYFTADDGFAVQAGSPVVNAGTGTNAPAGDIRGASHSATAVDIGAYERNARWYVDRAANGDGSSWASAAANLAAVTMSAGTADDVWVKAGTYVPTFGTDRARTFAVPANGGLWGGFNGTETTRIQRQPFVNRTTLSGEIGATNTTADNSQHVVTGASGGTLDGFIVQGGCAEIGSPWGSGAGGGIYLNGASNVTIANCVVANNQSSYAGSGLFGQDANGLTITNCLFANNSNTPTATLIWGNGVMLYGSSGSQAATIQNCTFINSSATVGVYGGALATYSAQSLDVRASVIWGNSGAYGIYSDGTSLSLSNSVLQGGAGIQFGAITDQGIITADPLLTNVANPIGPDGLWLTTDDGAIPGFGGPAVNISGLTNVPSTDLLGTSRATMGLPDLGAYEVPNAVTITATDASATESPLTTGTVTVTRSGPTTVPMVVSLGLAGNSTASASDFTMPSSVTIPVGASSASVFVTPVNDAFQENPETVVVKLANGNTATVTITSDDAVGVNLSKTSTTIGESGTISDTFTVTLNAQPTAPVTINMNSLDTSEFTVSPASISFSAANGVWSTAQTVTISRVDDDVADGPVTATLQTDACISDDQNYSGLAVADVVVTVQDDDVKGLTTSLSSVSVTEGQGSATYTVALASQPTGNVTVSVTSADTATGVTVTPTSLSFSPSSWKTAQTVTVTAVNDDRDEASPLAVNMTHGATGADYGSISRTVTANVTDDDLTPTLSIASLSVNENGGPAVLAVTLSGKSAGTVTLTYGTTDGTATSADYTTTNGSLSWGPGETGAKSFSIPITNDALDEANETLTISFSGVAVSGGHPALSTTSGSGVVTINDDDATPTVQFTDINGTALPTLTLAETTGLTGAISARLNAVSGQTVTVPFTVTGTASAGSDFTLTASPLTIPAGTQQVAATISVIGDTVNEENETIILTMGTPTNATASGNTTTTATITDNDAVPALTLAFSTASVAENGTSPTLTVTKSNASQKVVTVPFTVTGTATGADYTMGASPLTITSGAATANITFSLINDALHEANETVIVTLGTPTNATVTGTQETTLTITNDDVLPTVSIAFASSPAAESIGTTSATVTLSAASGQNVTVPLVAAGTATSGTDYALSTTTVTIPAGSTTGTVSVSVTDDDLYEGTETIALSFGTLVNAGSGTPATATLSLSDNEAQPTVSIAAVSATEAGDGAQTTTMQVPITLSGKVQGGVSVKVNSGAPASGTAATAGGANDYLAVTNQTIAWSASESGVKYLSVTILGNDDVQENDEEFSLTLSNLVGNALLGTSAADMTIHDDDVAGINIGASQVAVSEGGAAQTVSAQLNTNPTGGVTVVIVATAVSQVEVSSDGSNFGTTAQRSFTAGSTPLPFYVRALVDSTDEADSHSGAVNFGVQADGGGYLTTMTASLSVLVADNDATPILTVATPATFTEPAGSSGTSNLTFTATLNHASVFPITASYATVSGTAIAGQDFTGTTGQVIFSALQTSVTFNIPIMADAIDEADETFTVTFDSPVNASLAVASVTATVQDHAGDLPPTVAFTSVTGTVTEGGATTLPVSLSSVSGKTVTVPITLTTASADGLDHDLSVLTVTIPSGSLTGAFALNALADAVVEGSETLTATIATPTNATVGSAPSFVLTIQDADTAQVVVSGSAGLALAEPAGAAGYSIALAKKPKGNVTIALSSSAASRMSVSPASLTFTSSNWASPQNVQVAVVDNLLVDGGTTANVLAAVSGPGGYQGLTVSPVPVTITDNDVPGFVMVASGTEVTEAGSTVTITGRLTSQPSATVTLPITLTAVESFTVASKLTASATSMVFTTADWASDHVITLTGQNNLFDDGDVQVIVDFQTASGDATYAQSSLTPTDLRITVRNDDNAGFLVTPLNGLTTTEGGGVALFTVKLDAKPQAAVTVPIASLGVGEGTVSTSLLTFNGTNYQTPQIVVVTGVDDAVQDGSQSYTVAIAGSGAGSGDLAYNNRVGPGVILANIDNDTAGVVLSTTGISLTEASGASSTASFQLHLATQPAGNITITIAHDAQVTVSPSTLTFGTAPSGTSGWTVDQTVTVTAVADLIAEDDPHASRISFSAASTAPGDVYQGIGIPVITASITDNNTADILVLAADGVSPIGALTVDEAGSTAAFTVALASQPTSNVVVVLSSDDTTEGVVTPASIAFSPADWNVPKTITVTGVDDRRHDGDMLWHVVTAAALSSDQAYNNLDAQDVTITAEDDDVPGLQVNLLGQLTTSEAGGTAAFQVALSTQPAPGTTVTVRSTSGDTGEVTTSSGLVFTPANWSTFQGITLTGINDAENDGDQTVTVSLSVVTDDAARDPDFDGLSSSVSVANADDDIPAILVSRTSGLQTTENGGVDSFTIVLSCQPTAPVTIPLSSSRANEGRLPYDQVVFTTTRDQILSVSGRTATAGWNVPVAVAVTGQDDQAVDGPQDYQVVLGIATSTDGDFLLNPTDVSVVNRDDEIPLTVTPTSLALTEGGAQGTVSLVLNGPPQNGSTVVIPISLTDFAQASLSATSVTFSTSNWNQIQRVTVTPVADGIADGSASLSVVIGAASSTTAAFSGYDAPDIPLTVQDQDSVGVRISRTSGLVTTEGGGTATTTIRLGSRPTAEVTVTIAGTSAIAVAPAVLTFTNANWDQAQQVTLTGQDEPGLNPDRSVPLAVTVGSGDGNYDGLVVQGLAVINLDDDAPGILALPTEGSTAVTEGGSADEVSIRLTTAPTGAVTVTLAPDGNLTVVPSTFTFTTATWNVPQSALIRAVDDASVEGVHGGSITLSAVGGGYDGVSGNPITAAITDNDQVGIRVSPVSGIITTEAGGTSAFTISLKSRPSSDVEIAVTSSDTDEITVSTALVVFTPDNYATSQTVVLTGVDDQRDDGDTTVVIALAPAVSLDPSYQALDPEDVTVTNRDDDAVGVVLSPAGGLLTSEAGVTSTFTVRLSSQPEAPVTMTLVSNNLAEALVSPATMTFTPSNWAVAQTATATGQNDAVRDGDAAFQITATATSTDGAYAGKTALTSGLNQDDDSPGLLVSLPDGPLLLAEGVTVPVRLRLALRTIPTHPVTATLSGAGSQITLSGTEFILADTTPIDIEVVAVDDPIAEGRVVVPLEITLASPDVDYSGVRQQGVLTTIADNDLPGIAVTPTSGLTTTEAGGTATFRVVLTAQPLSPITIGLSSSDLGQGTVSPSTLTFLPTSWDQGQTVTVTGADTNGLEDGDIGYRIVTATAVAAAGMSDPYQGFDAADVLVVNQVVDNPPTIAKPADVVVAEDPGTQTVMLSGISSGQAAEDQSLVVTVVSSNESVTGVPTVTYTDKAATGILTFTPPLHGEGTASLTVSVSDGTTAISTVFTVTINPVNDLPVVTRNKPLTIGLRGTGILRGSQALAADANQLAAEDIETAADAVTFRVMLVPGGGVLAVAGQALANGGSFTQAQLVAGQVAYTHSGGGGDSDGFTFRVEDGAGGTSTPDVFVINIDRRAPDVTVAPTLPAALTYTENDPALGLANQATLADADNTSYNSAQVRVAIATGAGTGDILEVVPQTTTRGELTVVAGTIRIDGVVMATLTGGVAGNDLVITGATAAVPADFQAILRCLAYRNGAEAPTPGLRTLTLTVIDPDATSTGAITLRPVTVEAVNDTPQLSSPAVVTATGRPVDGRVSVTDPDGPGVTLSLVTPPVKGVVTVDLATGAFSYAPAAGLAGIDTFVIQGTDGLATSAPLTVTIRITGSGSTIRPWIISDPPMEIQANELLRLPVTVDTRELPPGFTLVFGVDGAPAGMTVTQDGPASAVVTWTAVAGSVSHVLFTLTATDGVSGSMSTLPVTLRVLPTVGGGG